MDTINLPVERPANLLTDPSYFAHLQRVAEALSKSSLMPRHYRGPGRVPDIVVALDMANRLRVPPIPFMACTYVAKEGAPLAMEGKLAIALVNAYGPFEGLLDWDYGRDAHGKIISCTCYGTLPDGSRREVTLTQEDLDRAGWGGIYERRKDEQGKWVKGDRIGDDPHSWWSKTPEQMYAYRTAMFLARRYCPEVVMGMITVDEQLDGLQPGKVVAVDPAMEIPADQLAQLEQQTQHVTSLDTELGTAVGDEDALITDLANRLKIKAGQEGQYLDFLDFSAEKHGKTRAQVAQAALDNLDRFRARLETYKQTASAPPSPSPLPPGAQRPLS